MALDEYVAAVVLEVDGQEIEVQSFGVTENTGKTPVVTMNRRRRIAGYAQGVTTYELSVSAVIPVSGSQVDWANIVGAKLVIYPVSGNGQRTAYTDCFTQSVGEQYQSEGEAVQDLTMTAVDKVYE